MPVAGSKSGHRIALLASWNQPVEETEVTVVDSDTQEPVAKCGLRKDEFPALFNANGSILYLLGKDHWVKCDLRSGAQTRFQDPYLSKPVGGGGGWNADRTIILIGRGTFGEADNRTAGKEADGWGEAFTQAGIGFPIKPGQIAGFDEFGHAWVGSGTRWLEVDETGRSTPRGQRPPYLVGDQSRQRGSMRLDTVEKVDHFKGATAYLDCIWLTDQKAGEEDIKGRFVSNDRTRKAALVFAGADVRYFGFVPGRDMVYVISDSGSFLVPIEKS